MSDKTTVSRRRFTITAASVGIASIAGCSDTGDNQTPAETDSDTPTSTSTSAETDTQTATETTGNETTNTTTDSVETASGTPADRVSDGVIETLADYEYVAENPEEFVGTTVSTPKMKYYDQYGEYEGFRKFFDSSGEVRPFFIRMDEEMSKYGNQEYSMEGTVEKVEELQGTPVIHMENDTVIESHVNGETKT